MNVSDYYLIDPWTKQDYNKTDNVGGKGRLNGVRSANHKHDWKEEQSVSSKLNRVEVVEYDFLQSEQPISVNCFDSGEIPKDFYSAENQADILAGDQPFGTHLHGSELVEEALEGRDDLHVHHSKKCQQTDPHIEQIVEHDAFNVFDLHLFV